MISFFHYTTARRLAKWR